MAVGVIGQECENWIRGGRQVSECDLLAQPASKIGKSAG